MAKKRVSYEIEGNTLIFRRPTPVDFSVVFGQFPSIPGWVTGGGDTVIDKDDPDYEPEERDNSEAQPETSTFDPLTNPKTPEDFQSQALFYEQVDRLILRCYIKGQKIILKSDDQYTIKDDQNPSVINLADIDDDVKIDLYQQLLAEGGFTKEALEDARRFPEEDGSA